MVEDLRRSVSHRASWWAREAQSIGGISFVEHSDHWIHKDNWNAVLHDGNRILLVVSQRYDASATESYLIVVPLSSYDSLNSSYSKGDNNQTTTDRRRPRKLSCMSAFQWLVAGPQREAWGPSQASLRGSRGNRQAGSRRIYVRVSRCAQGIEYSSRPNHKHGWNRYVRICELAWGILFWD